MASSAAPAASSAIVPGSGTSAARGVAKISTFISLPLSQAPLWNGSSTNDGVFGSPRLKTRYAPSARSCGTPLADPFDMWLNQKPYDVNGFGFLPVPHTPNSCTEPPPTI